MRKEDKTILDAMEKYPKKRPRSSSVRAKSSVAKSLKKTTQKRKPSSSIGFKVFTSFVILLFLGLGVKFYWDENHKNPLIGKWRAQTSLGILEVQFERDSMLFFGTKTPVSYDIGEKQIIVFDDDIKVGNVYKLIDKDTIATESGGHKTVYKRVK